MISYPTMAASEYDGESPITEALIIKFHDRDEALISQPIDTRFAEGSNNTNSYVQIASLSVFIPQAAATTDGNVTLVVVLQARVTAGNGKVRVKLGAGSYVESAEFANTSYADKTITIAVADVRAAAGTAVALVVETKYSTSAGTCYAKCDTCASHLER